MELIVLYAAAFFTSLWNPVLPLGLAGGNLYLSIFLILILIFILFFRKLVIKQKKMRLTNLSLPILFFLISIFCSGLVNGIDSKTIIIEMFRYSYIWLCIPLGANIIKTQKQFFAIIYILLISLTIRSIWELSNSTFLTDPSVRNRLAPESLLWNPFGYLVSSVMLLSIIFIGNNLKNYRKIFIMPFLVVLLTALFASYSRGSMGSLFAGLLLWLLFTTKSSKALLASIILFAFVVYANLPPSFSDVIGHFGKGLTEEGQMVRRDIYSIAWDVFKDNFIFGIGPGNISKYLGFEGYILVSSAHNAFLQHLGELGLFGFISYISIIIFIYRKGLLIIRRNSDCRVKYFVKGVLIVFTSLIIVELTGQYATVLQTSWIIGITIGSMYSMEKNYLTFFPTC